MGVEAAGFGDWVGCGVTVRLSSSLPRRPHHVPHDPSIPRAAHLHPRLIARVETHRASLPQRSLCFARGYCEARALFRHERDACACARSCRERDAHARVSLDLRQRRRGLSSQDLLHPGRETHLTGRQHVERREWWRRRYHACRRFGRRSYRVGRWWQRTRVSRFGPARREPQAREQRCVTRSPGLHALRLLPPAWHPWERGSRSGRRRPFGSSPGTRRPGR